MKTRMKVRGVNLGGGPNKGRLFGIMLTNLLGIVVTLGLFRPFAVTRLLKYRLQSVTLVAAGDLDGFVAGQEGAVGAVGEEAAEMFDIDISL